MLAYSPRMAGGSDLGVCDTFAVIGVSIAENFAVALPEGAIGASILKISDKILYK